MMTSAIGNGENQLSTGKVEQKETNTNFVEKITKTLQNKFAPKSNDLVLVCTIHGQKVYRKLTKGEFRQRQRSYQSGVKIGVGIGLIITVILMYQISHIARQILQ